MTLKYLEFRPQLLELLGIQPTDRRIGMIGAWAASKIMPAWTYNPLAGNQSWPGSKTLTESGVQGYLSYDDGLAATAYKLNTPEMRDVVRTLDQGDNYSDLFAAIRATSWPWVGLDDNYPAYVRYWADFHDRSTPYPALPEVTSGVHGGFPHHGVKESSNALARAATNSIRRIQDGRQAVRQAMQRMARHG